MPVLELRSAVMHVEQRPSRLRSFLTLAVPSLGLVLSFSLTAFASPTASYTKFGHDIDISANQSVGDLTCLGCSIRVRGKVAGDVTTVGGSIVVEDQAQVAGDVTAVGGNVRLGAGIQVAGDATVVAGELHRDPQATVGGDITEMGGRGWLLLIVLFPFVVLGLLVAFVVWLIERLRQPSVPAAAA
jgi:hypothetical protein